MRYGYRFVPQVLPELPPRQLIIQSPDCNAQSDLWYTGSYSENQWIADLKTLASRYANVSNFIGLDLKYEPHGMATWGTGNTATDWDLAAARAGQDNFSKKYAGYLGSAVGIFGRK